MSYLIVYIYYMAYILKKRLKGRAYYYLAEAQRVDGKPRIIWQKYLGTADKIKEKLMAAPSEGIEDIVTLELGSVAAVESIEEVVRFADIVDDVVPKRNQGMRIGQYLYLLLLNRIIEPKSKASLGEWLKKTAVTEYREVDFSLIDSKNLWDHLDKVEEKHIKAIGDAVSKRIVELYDISLDCLLYDTTNYFNQMSPVTDSKLSRYAHSKAGKHHLRHVGLALLCTREEGIPLFHRLYSANVHDSKILAQIRQELFSLLFSFKKGKERMTLIFDKGCNSPDNFAAIDASEFYFIGTLSTYHHPRLCRIPLSSFKEITIEGKPLWIYQTTMELYGKERSVVVSFNPRTYERKIHWLSRTMVKTKRKLQELRQELKNADGRTTVQSVERHVNEILSESHIAPVFDVKVSCRYRKFQMSIRTHPQVIKDYRSRFGKNIILTDHLDWEAEEIIRAYRDRYKIEAAFRMTKDPFHIRFEPMFCWTDSKIQVHGLTCVMALLYLALLHKKLVDAEADISLDRAMDMLRGIRLVHCYYPNKSRPVQKICRICSTEKKLLKALNIKLSGVR
ncbi:MAG: IS1634 family transposase [Candidatus Aminicenantes bacterium]|nr:IS1634 family transposase [Candidatus Aminicenantes bacterium]